MGAEKIIRKPAFLNFNGRLHSLELPMVMGILNVTADSFFDGGKYTTEESILQRAQRILDEGADLIDIGAASTRPGAADVPEEAEMHAIVTAVDLIQTHFPKTALSIDTWRASVAREAIRHGASMINDVSGGTFDEQMIPLIGAEQIPYCLMHTPAKPDTMQRCTQYDDLLADMLRFFDAQLDKLHRVSAHDILIDPGFGFGKTLEQNYFLMKNLHAFKVFGLPLFIGISRKSMIYNLLDCTPQEALNGTTVLNTWSLLQDASMLRVHDVKEAVEVRTMLCQAAL